MSQSYYKMIFSSNYRNYFKIIKSRHFPVRFKKSTKVIFCTRWINRSGPQFKMESEPLQISMRKWGFDPGILRPAASALTTRQAGGAVFKENVF